MKKLKTFIFGENIDLCIPTEDFAKNSNWFQLINSKKNNKYLDHGIYPNTPEDQLEFLKNSKISGRIVLIIMNKKNNFIGVINLSNINNINKSADIALVLNQDTKIGHVSKNYLSALEAISLMTTHAFENIDLCRINAGQSIGLLKWQNLMELAGYKIEGINKKKFKKNNIFFDTMTISCLKNDYEILKKNRGKLWDSNKNMLKRIKKLPKKTAYANLSKALKNLDKLYYKKIFKL